MWFITERRFSIKEFVGLSRAIYYWGPKGFSTIAYRFYSKDEVINFPRFAIDLNILHPILEINPNISIDKNIGLMLPRAIRTKLGMRGANIAAFILKALLILFLLLVITLVVLAMIVTG